MEQKASGNQVQLNNYKIPGMRGPRNRGREVEKPKEGRKTLKRLLTYFGKELKMMIALLAAVFIIVICSVYAPRLQSNAIDYIAAGQFSMLTPVLLMMTGLYLVNSVCTFIQTRFSAILSQRVVKKMRQDLFQSIVNLPIKYLDSHPHGDIMSRMTNDVENISNTVSQSLSSLFSEGDD